MQKTQRDMSAALGQSQEDREAPELDPRSVEIDARGPADMARFAERFSKFVHYHRDQVDAPDGTFEPFFAGAVEATKKLSSSPDGAAPPHLALFSAFLALREESRRLVNRIPERHLDFHFQRVLGFSPRAAEPDRAHVVLELKKNAERTPIGEAHFFSAGKDGKGVEQLYRPTHEMVAGSARIEELRSIYAGDPGGALVCAPIANSSNGLGEPLPSVEPWFPPFGRPFGEPALPRKSVGFAISSPVLRMKEGIRTVTIVLFVAGATEVPAGGFEVQVTGDKGWFGPAGGVTFSGEAGRWQIQFTLSERESAVVDYAPGIHEGSFDASGPLVKLVLSETAASARLTLKDVVASKVQVSVAVTGVRSLVLENDVGRVDPKKPFLPFGPQPEIGSRFQVRHDEALSKKLIKLAVHLGWAQLPDFTSHFEGYGEPAVFEVSAGALDGSGGALGFSAASLFPSLPPETASHFVLTSGGGAAEGAAGSCITFSIGKGIFQEAHRKKTAENAAAFARGMGEYVQAVAKPTINISGTDTKTVTVDYAGELPQYPTLSALNPPYIPKASSISLDYETAFSEVDLQSTLAEEFEKSDVAFFHVDCFGTRREHRHLRQKLPFSVGTSIPLLPPHDHEGEFFLGIGGLSPGDSVSLLFRVAEGTADPDVSWPDLQWFVLSHDHFRPLGKDEVARESTASFRRTGVVVLAVPRDATTENRLLPAGKIWFKAAIATGAAAVSRLVSVETNGVELEFVDRGNDPFRLESPLPSGKITKLATPVASVKKVSQPDPSAGGRPQESPSALRIRAAERLRHKGRAITPWDYERLVLEAFPSIHEVKCVPHAKPDHFFAPGNVLVVLVPDLRHACTRSRLEPRVDVDTITSVKDFLDARKGMQVAVHVKNPWFQKVQVDLAVKFRGVDFNAQRSALSRDLVALLSPWAFDASRPIEFGGTLYASALLDFVEELDYVDYVESFTMLTYSTTPEDAREVSELRPDRPDAILVSAEAHEIREAR